MNHIVRICYKIFDVVPGGIVSSDLDEPTASPPRLSAAVCEAGERFLSVHERRL